MRSFMLFGLAAGLSLDSNSQKAFLAARDEPAAAPAPAAPAAPAAPTTGPVPPPAGQVPGLEFHLNLPSLNWEQFAAHPEVKASLREVIKGGAFEMVHALMTHAKGDPVMPDIDGEPETATAAASGAPAGAPAAPGTPGDDHPPMPTELAAPVAPSEEPEFVNGPAGPVAAAPGEATPTPLAEAVAAAPAAAAPAVAAVATPVAAGSPAPVEDAAAAEEAPALSEVEKASKEEASKEEAKSEDDNVDSEDESFLQLNLKSQSLFSLKSKVDPAAVKKEEDAGQLRIFVEFEETPNEQVAARVTAKGSEITPEMVEKLEHEFEANKGFYATEVESLFRELLKDTSNVQWAGEPDVEVSEEVHDVSIHNFVHECVDHTKHILQNLKKTYTPVQVPAVLAHNCDTYMTMFSFDTERGEHTGSPNDNARCAIFTRQLQSLFWKTYKAKDISKAHFGVSRWCKDICDSKYGAAPECDAVTVGEQ